MARVTFPGEPGHALVSKRPGRRLPSCENHMVLEYDKKLLQIHHLKCKYFTIGTHPAFWHVDEILRKLFIHPLVVLYIL